MNLSKRINAVRRGLMHGLTKNIGHTRISPNVGPAAKTVIKRILICRPNHRLGNLLLITPLMQEIANTFPDCKVDLFVKGGLAPILFKNYDNVDKIIQLPRKHFNHLIRYIGGWLSVRKNRYDIVINAARTSSSGRLSTQLARADYKFFGEDVGRLQSQYEDYEHAAKYPVYAFREYLSMLGFPKSNEPVPPLDLKLSPSEMEDGRDILQKLVNNEKETICLFTYATGPKRFSESWWNEFYERLKAEYPGYNILEILPKENVSQIAFKARSFYSMDIRGMGAVIANTAVFIGTDSGVMHLACSAHTPTIGLFSVTNENVYGPYGRHSLSIKGDPVRIDECIGAVRGILANRHR